MLRRSRFIPQLEWLECRSVPALLHFNGPYITELGNGFGGSDTSGIESGFLTFGYFANADQYHIADDFVVPAGLVGWNIAQIKVLTYQTNGPVNGGNFSKIEFRLYQGDPAAGGTLKLDCSGPMGIVNPSAVFQNVYRVESGNPLSQARAVHKITANVCTPSGQLRLPPNTYWLEWWTTGMPTLTGPWANPVVPWQASHNAKQYEVASGTWQNAADPNGKTQDLPFEIHGRCVAGIASCTPAPPGIDAIDAWMATFWVGDRAHATYYRAIDEWTDRSVDLPFQPSYAGQNEVSPNHRARFDSFQSPFPKLPRRAVESSLIRFVDSVMSTLGSFANSFAL
jgi:hypothetical protein